MNYLYAINIIKLGDLMRLPVIPWTIERAIQGVVYQIQYEKHVAEQRQ